MHREKTPDAREYDELVQRVSPRSSAGSTALALVKAFGVGGLICCLGQAVRDLGAGPLGLDDKAVSAFTSTALIFLSALLTGLGLYDRIGKFASYFEFDRFLCRDSDFCFCRRVNGSAFAVFFQRECAETYEDDFFVGDECIAYAFHYSVNSLLGICLAQPGFLCDRDDQICFVHSYGIKNLRMLFLQSTV